jgi:hypothetical protein
LIPLEVEAAILRLHRVEGWPVGTIARELGIHHDVVERVLEQAGIPRPKRVRASRIDPFVPFIQETWAKYPRLPASRLYRMCRERGYVGSGDHFRHAVACYRPRKPVEAFLRLRTLPGEQAQVDWAHFGRQEIGRASHPLMAFVMVLSYSRAIFLRFFLSQRAECFLRGHQEAFAYFGGIARVCLYAWAMPSATIPCCWPLPRTTVSRRGRWVHGAATRRGASSGQFGSCARASSWRARGAMSRT